MNVHDNAEALLRVLTAPRRNQFFYGKRMDVQHFRMEQDYGKLKQWLLNRLTLGKGVLCGLRVTVEGERICVDPGVAIDGLGREIIVPVRSCIDPLAPDEGCCGGKLSGDLRPGEPPAAPADGSAPTHGNRPDGQPDDDRRPRIFTLWLCYRECLADHEPTFVTDCDAPGHCAAGTLVESFCLQVRPGLAPPQGDPTWCAHLWHGEQGHDDGEPGRPPVPAPAPTPGAGPAAGDISSLTHVSAASGLPLTPEQLAALRDAMDSRRHGLCELFDHSCEPHEGDPCVPLALIVARDGRLVVESCAVRPRIYSNAVLLDLILCLAVKIDECCNGHEPPDPAPAPQPMRLRSVDFLRRNADGAEVVVASMATPLVDTPVPIARNANAIRLRFDHAFAQDQHVPTTHALGDANFERHNVQVLPQEALGDLAYVPGTLAIEAPDTIRFDLFPDSPYARGSRGWQKGRYRIALRGNENLPAQQQAVADLSGAAFDGEAIAPAGGLISGDGTKGGDFSAWFVVGAGEVPPEPMRVASVDFVDRTIEAGGGVVATVADAREETRVTTRRIDAIRIRMTKPVRADGPNAPSTHDVDDADFRRHNVQLRLPPEEARRRGVEFVPGRVTLESADTLRFEPTPGTRIVDPNGQWPRGRSRYELFLRGDGNNAGGQPALVDTGGFELDGEAATPSGGVLSGDGAPGGDFVAAFIVDTER